MNHRFFGPGFHPGFGVMGGLLPILLFALFVGVIAFAVARLAGMDHPRHPLGIPPGPPTPPPGPWPQGSWAQGPWAAPQDDALSAARMRYARGELDRDAYFRLVEDLTGAPMPGAPPTVAGPPAQPGT